MSRYTVFLSAGEPSGDFLGSQLMKVLKGRLGHEVTFVGLGGPLMAAEGLSSLFAIEELSIMGLTEVIPHIWRIRCRIQETVDAIKTMRPDIVVTIDSPGFNFRVGKALKKQNGSIPLVHYVAPSVWAWRPGRARNVAQFLDHLLVLLPFEPPYFLKEGLPTHFVGHPVVELGLEKRWWPVISKETQNSRFCSHFDSSSRKSPRGAFSVITDFPRNDLTTSAKISQFTSDYSNIAAFAKPSSKAFYPSGHSSDDPH